MLEDGFRASETELTSPDSNKFDDMLPFLDHVIAKEQMDDSTLLSLTDSSQDDNMITPNIIEKQVSLNKRISKIQRPRVFRKQTSSIANTSLQTLNDIHSRSNDRFSGLEDSLIPNVHSVQREKIKMRKGNISAYNRSHSAPQFKLSSQGTKHHQLIRKSESYSGRAETSVPLEQLISQFNSLETLQKDHLEKMRLKSSIQVTDNAEDEMDHQSDCFHPPSIIEFQNVMSIFVQKRYENEGDFVQINSKETGLYDFLVQYRENIISAKELAQEIMHVLFRQDLPKDGTWEMGDTMSREIVLPLGEQGFSIFVESCDVSASDTVRTSSVTGRVIFVFDCNEIQIENYSFIITSEASNMKLAKSSTRSLEEKE